MANGKMIIDAPTVLIENDKVVYSARINDDGKIKKLYYKFPVEYKKYLDIENCDAFLCALLYYAMNKSLDIEINGNLTEQLYYQITNYLIPILSDSINLFHNISIKTCINIKAPNNAGGVGTGISGGVDSLYTIKKYITSPLTTYKISHLIFCDIFASEYSEEERISWLEKNVRIFKRISKDLGLKLVIVETNLDKEFSIGKQEDNKIGVFQDAGLFTLKYCSIAFALRKLFKIYYFSSGYEVKDFSIYPNPYDTATYDIFSLKCLSTEKLFFYSSGTEASRIQKVEFLLDDKIAQKYMQVCGISNNNCGRCEKCIRTMGELYVLGKLDQFDAIFPIEDFKKNLAKRFGFIRAEALRKNVYDQEILRLAKKNKVYIPPVAYLYCLLNIPMNYLRRKLSKSCILRKIYYKYNIDEYRFGVRPRRKRI